MAVKRDLLNAFTMLMINAQMTSQIKVLEIQVSPNFKTDGFPNVIKLVTGLNFTYKTDGSSWGTQISISFRRIENILEFTMNDVIYPNQSLVTFKRFNLLYYDYQEAHKAPYLYSVYWQWRSPPNKYTLQQGFQNNLLGLYSFTIRGQKFLTFNMTINTELASFQIIANDQRQRLFYQLVFKEYYCPEGFDYLWEGQNLCLNYYNCRVDECIKCLIDLDVCNLCKPGFKPSADSKVCEVVCDLPCQTCTSQTACSSCIIRYYLEDTTCIPCSTIPHCVDCLPSAPSVCIECESDLYNVLNGFCVLKCGDGTLHPGQQCDDGNLLDGDGCNSDCTLGNNNGCPKETPFKDPNTGLCTASCPDGYYDAANYNCALCKYSCATCANAQECQTCDSSTNRELLSQQCVPKSGYYEPATPTKVAAPCIPPCQTCTSETACSSCIANHYLEGTTYLLCTTIFRCLQCKPTAPAFCTLCSAGYYPDQSGACTNVKCGDGIRVASQVCDNSNMTGCLNCVQQPGYICTAQLEKLSVCSSVCGDGIFTPEESCDTGNKTGCLNNCQPDASYSCKNVLGQTSICYLCGNRILEYTETCDVNNKQACINCQVQPGWNCDVSGCSKGSFCGNGIIGEKCDDGNVVDGDGCNSKCHIER